MMTDQLMQLARRVADEVEIYEERTSTTTIRFSNGHADDIQSSMLGGTALRLLKSGKVGFSYARNGREPERLIEGAVASLAAGVEGPGSFASTSQVPPLATWDPSIDAVTTEMLADECRRASEGLARRIGGFGGGTVGCVLQSRVHEVRVTTGTGSGLSARESAVMGIPSLAFPGTAAALYRQESAPRFQPISDETLDFLGETYARATTGCGAQWPGAGSLHADGDDHAGLASDRGNERPIHRAERVAPHRPHRADGRPSEFHCGRRSVERRVPRGAFVRR
jgi:hypothetical protein